MKKKPTKTKNKVVLPHTLYVHTDKQVPLGSKIITLPAVANGLKGGMEINIDYFFDKRTSTLEIVGVEIIDFDRLHINGVEIK